MDHVPQDHVPQDHGAPGRPNPTADAAARALRDYFLTNADRGDHAANDELVAEMVRRIRALQASQEDRY